MTNVIKKHSISTELAPKIPTLARMAAWGGGFPIRVNEEVVGAIGVSGAPTVQYDVDCAKAAQAVVADGVPGGLNGNWFTAIDNWFTAQERDEFAT